MSKDNKYSRHADNSAKKIEQEKLRISFEYLDWETKEFFFHGLEASYYERFFSVVTELKKIRGKEITEQTYYALSPKSIFNSKTSIKKIFQVKFLQS